MSGHQLGERLLVESLGVVLVAQGHVTGHNQYRITVTGRRDQAGGRVRQVRALSHRGYTRPPGEPGIPVGHAHDTLLVAAFHDGHPAAFTKIAHQVLVPVADQTEHHVHSLAGERVGDALPELHAVPLLSGPMMRRNENRDSLRGPPESGLAFASQ